MCLFTCGDSHREEEEDRIIVAARPVQPTIIRTAATFPVQHRSRPVSSHGQVIALKPVSPRGSPHGSSYSQRRSSSRSPRGSGQELVITQRGSNQQVVVRNDAAYVDIAPDRTRPGNPTRNSSQRIRFEDPRAPVLAANMLRPVSAQVVPIMRRSAGNVVLQRSPSQRAVHGPRISDSVLIRRDERIFATGQIVAPGRRSVVDISPRDSRVSQISTGVVEIQTAGGRSSRRQSAVITNSARTSDVWRPSERYTLVDSRGNKIEYYR